MMITYLASNVKCGQINNENSSVRFLQLVPFSDYKYACLVEQNVESLHHEIGSILSC